VPSTPARPGNPQPNVLADGAQPNRLSTPSTAGAPGVPGRAEAPRVAVASNRLATANPSARLPVTADSRFETRRRRAPSLATIIVVGFLLVTGFRVIAALAGRFIPDQSTPTTAPLFVPGGDAQAGTIEFGTATDGLCGIAGVAVAFDSGTDVWWSAHLARGANADEAVVVVVTRKGVEVEQETTSVRDLGANGSAVVCAIKPRDDTLPGTYVLQLWDATQRRVLASGDYTING
jgi:hypothetical protein